MTAPTLVQNTLRTRPITPNALRTHPSTQNSFGIRSEYTQNTPPHLDSIQTAENHTETLRMFSEQIQSTQNTQTHTTHPKRTLTY
jgi:hypothetical protein